MNLFQQSDNHSSQLVCFCDRCKWFCNSVPPQPKEAFLLSGQLNETRLQPQMSQDA